jgi:hypothetical protein
MADPLCRKCQQGADYPMHWEGFAGYHPFEPDEPKRCTCGEDEHGRIASFDCPEHGLNRPEPEPRAGISPHVAFSCPRCRRACSSNGCDCEDEPAKEAGQELPTRQELCALETFQPNVAAYLRRVEAELSRLRDAVESAPHEEDCSFWDPTPTSAFGTCDCWLSTVAHRNGDDNG